MTRYERRHDHDRRRSSQEQITATLPGARLGTDRPRHLTLYLALHSHRRVEPRTRCIPIELRFYYALCRWRNGIVIISASAFAASQSTRGDAGATRYRLSTCCGEQCGIARHKGHSSVHQQIRSQLPLFKGCACSTIRLYASGLFLCSVPRRLRRADQRVPFSPPHRHRQ